jgi:hypothetical protein
MKIGFTTPMRVSMPMHLQGYPLFIISVAKILANGREKFHDWQVNLGIRH